MKKLTSLYQPEKPGSRPGENHNALSRFYNGTPVPTFTVNKDHVVTHWNTACAKLTGIPAIDIIGTRNAWQAFYPRKRPVLADLIVDASSESTIAWYYNGRYKKSELATGGYEVQKYVPYLREAGRWLHVAATALRDSSGRIAGGMETLQDVTACRGAMPAASGRHERFEALMDVMPDIIFFKDGSGRWLPI